MSKAGFVTIMAAALAIRILLIATTFGTTDAFLFMIWTRLAEDKGIVAAYSYVRLLNHPPLSMAIAIAAEHFGRFVHLEFPDVFRSLQVLADILTAACVYRLAEQTRPAQAREFTAFFFASPAAIMLSGFHCNSDPSMIALLTAAVLTASRQRPAASGALVGLASGIKIVPMPLAPMLLIHLTWRQRALFCMAAGLIIGAAFGPAIWIGRSVVIQHIFGYAGTGSQWGFSGVGYIAAYLSRAALPIGFGWAMWYARYGRYIVIAALGGLFLWGWRYKSPLPAVIAIALLTMNFFAPGFGVQYLVWPIALLPLAVPRRVAYTLNAALSAFLFVTYTIWAREFPWWYADASAQNPYRPIIAFLGIPLWLLYGWAIVAALRNASGQLRTQELTEG